MTPLHEQHTTNLPSNRIWLDLYQANWIQLHIHMWCVSYPGDFRVPESINCRKKSVRAITSSKFNAHSEPLFKRPNILKIRDIFDKQRLQFYHNLCNDMLPDFVKSMYVKHGLIHQRDTRQRDETRNFTTCKVFHFTYRNIYLQNTPMSVNTRLLRL